ncbi:right-handed parallel beta-helix repeat-containing protein [Sporosarcina psychrophila]|uniref:Parallel beta-helix repeat protein n=1 Tax=Sporosarcina psychrophila TaxID=1476 RepID=A0ABV2KEQ6_SPOPS
MANNYIPTDWKDEIVDGAGNVVQKGTPLSAANLKKLEAGVEGAVAAVVDKVDGAVFEQFKTATTSQLADTAYFPEQFAGATDKEKITNAFSFLQAGNTLKLKPNKFYTIDSLTISNKSGIIIDGQGSEIHLTDTSKSVKVINSTDVVIKNLKVKMVTSARNYASGITLENVDNFIVEDCEIDGSNATGIICWKCSEGVIRNNKVKNTLADGIHLTRGSSNIDVYGNTVTNTGDDGIAVISYQSDGVPNKEINIYSNKVEKTGARGITVGGGQDISVFLNDVKDTYVNGILVMCEQDYPLFGFNNIHVFGNKVKGAGEYGSNPLPVASIYIRNDILSNGSSTVTVGGNQTKGGTGEGFRAINVSNLIVFDNVFENLVYLFSDIFKCSDVNMHDNVFKGVGGAVMQNGLNIRYCYDVDIHHNGIENAGQTGIYVVGSGADMSQNISVDHNKIINPNTSTTAIKDGIALEYVNDLSIVGNDIKVGNALRTAVIVANNCAGSIVVENNGYTPDAIFTGSIPILVSANSIKSQRSKIGYGATIPTSGTWQRGDIIYNTVPAASGYLGWVCTTFGTNGSLFSVTGSITTGSNALTVNNVTGLTIGRYITIVGVAGKFRITKINDLTVTLDNTANATVVGASVSYSAATFKGFGLIEA